jgi:hypothetical protein
MSMRTSTVVGILGIVSLAFSGTVSAELPVYDIREIQMSDASYDWKSPHEGEDVNCERGIVTHKFRNRYVIQDPSLGSEWAAVEVRAWPFPAYGLEVGDQADFQNVSVAEYRGVTVLTYHQESSFVINSRENPLPDPVPISIWEIRNPPHPEDCEKYAAMLVEISEEVTIGAMGLGHAEDNYELLSVLGDTAWASDYANTDIDTTYYVSQGECYRWMAGVLQRYTDDGTWDHYQLLPRRNLDYAHCISTVDEEVTLTDDSVWLGRAVPNPFNPATVIPFHLAGPGPVDLSVYDVSGRKVTSLVDGVCGAGYRDVRWDGKNERGEPMPSGIYLIRLNAGGERRSAKVCLVR